MYEYRCVRCGTCSPHNKECFLCGCKEKQRVPRVTPARAMQEAKKQDFDRRRKEAVSRHRKRNKA